MKNDDAYANAAHIEGGHDYPARWAEAADAFRGSARMERNVRYSEVRRGRMDLFHPDRMALGLVVFFHGGYWLRFGKSTFSHLAAGPLARGWAVAMPSYPLAPEYRIGAIVQAAAQAVSGAAGRVPGPVVVAGHSAGGHLALRAACRDARLPAPVRDRLKRVVAISPIADLRPLLDTSMNAELRLDADEAEAESPVLARPLEIPVTVWVGAEERPAFLDQARALADTWKHARLVEDPGRHHFDVIAAMAEADSPLTEALVAD